MKTEKIAIILTVLLASSLAWAQQAPGNNEPHSEPRPTDRERPAMRFRGGPGGSGRSQGGLSRFIESAAAAKRFGITEQQQQAIGEEMEELRVREHQLREKVQQAAMLQAQLLLEKEIDREALMAAVEATGRIKTEMAKVHMEKLLIMREHLTAEQQAKIRQYMREKGKREREKGASSHARASGHRSKSDTSTQRTPPSETK